MHSPVNRPGSYFLYGLKTAFSVPGFVLFTAFVGFAGLAREAGLTATHTVFMTGVVWALPAKLVLVGAILSGSGLLAAAIAVALSSIRLLPMAASLIPEIRTPATKKWTLYALSHFIAVTSWVLAMERIRQVPREYRTAYYAGLGGTLVVVNMLIVTCVFQFDAFLTPEVSAAMFFLTPIYFLTSLWGSAREKAAHAAMLLGLALGPLVHLAAPDFDILIAGLAGGLIAFALHRYQATRKSRP